MWKHGIGVGNTNRLVKVIIDMETSVLIRKTDLRKIYNHSVLYSRNKMAFETPLAPGGSHF